MGKHEKFLLKILSGTSDANIHFEHLCDLLRNLGFEERIRGSLISLEKKGVVEKINLKREKDKAKPYQVKQVRNVILKYKSGGKINVQI